MRKDITVAAEQRDTRGKNEARRLRVAGSIPAVLYGNSQEPVAVAVSPKDLSKILHSSSGHNTIFNLDVKDKELTPVMIVDWQHDPIRSNLLHVDLKRIDLNKRLHVSVEVHITGEARGVKIQGGLLEQITRAVEIECLPDDIPEHFTVNVTDLGLNQSVRAGDIPMPGTVKLLSPADSVLAHVISLRSSTADETADAAKTAEPEVIKKGKKEEEGAAEAKPKKK